VAQKAHGAAMAALTTLPLWHYPYKVVTLNPNTKTRKVPRQGYPKRQICETVVQNVP
jgi:hypothetical protein